MLLLCHLKIWADIVGQLDTVAGDLLEEFDEEAKDDASLNALLLLCASVQHLPSTLHSLMSDVVHFAVKACGFELSPDMSSTVNTFPG